MNRRYKLLSAAALLICLGFAVIYQVGRRKTADDPPVRMAATRSDMPHDRRQTSTTAAVTRRDKERIRSTLTSVRKYDDVPFGRDEMPVRELEDLLKTRPGDLAFVRELMMETQSKSLKTHWLLAEALVRRYRDGDFQRLGELIDALALEGVGIGLRVQNLASAFLDLRAKDGDLAVRAFDELLARPAKVIRPFHYDAIATAAARTLGYPEALARIPDIQDGNFGRAAAHELIRTWMLADPVAASSYVRDLPASPYRDSLIVPIVGRIAESGDIEMAHEWANHLQGDAKKEALKSAELMCDSFIRLEEDRKKRNPEEE